MQHQFTWKETWFLDRLKFGKKMILEIHLVGGKKGTPEEVLVRNINLGVATPILRDPSKRAIIRFFRPLTFQRLDESFAAEKGGIYTGERFCVYTKSAYLDYFSKVSYGIVDSPILHYCMTCADDIIDVLSCDPPEIISC